MGSNAGFHPYLYNPSFAAAVVLAVVFAKTTALHGVQMIRHKTWFMIPFFIGGLFEVAGYVGRAVSDKEKPDYTLGPFIVQTLFLLIAPLFLAATVYMTLGRIIRYTNGEKYSVIRLRWLTKIFVIGDVATFMVQGAGGGLMASDNKQQMNTGRIIVISGLFLQLAFFGFFIIVSVIFSNRLNAKPTEESTIQPRWRMHLKMLFATSTLILIRSLFRIVEYISGMESYLLRHEAFLYIFDGLLMFVTMILLNIVHPHEVGMPQPAKDIESQEKEAQVIENVS